MVRRLPYACLALCCALSWLFAGAALAQPQAAVQLPKGEHVLSAAWAGTARMSVLVSTGSGLGLRSIDLDSGQVESPAVPKSFQALKANGGAVMKLSPSGSGLAVLEPSSDPLNRPGLSLYLYESGQWVESSTRQVPRSFFTGQMAWDEQGTRLYLAAMPYISPDQLYSLGMLSAGGGAFQGLLLKDNLDLISEIAYLPVRDGLALRCKGYQGTYPAEPFIALLDLAQMKYYLLHSEAAGLKMRALSNGELLLFPENGNSAGDEWMLALGTTRLRKAAIASKINRATLETSLNGAWLGFIADAGVLGVKGKPEEKYLGLQRVADGKTMVSAAASSDFWFSLADLVCALSADRSAFYFYKLP